MIIIITGDIGSGKSATMTYHALKRMATGFTVFTNFTLKPPKDLKGRWKLLDPNTFDDFDYWKGQLEGKVCIMIDEIHNVIDARRAMSRKNIKTTHWLAQIRKVLKGHSTNHLICATQYLRQVDIRIRDLAQRMMECRFIKGRTREEDTVINTHFAKDFNGDFAYVKRTAFNPSFIYRYYDTYELIDFGSSGMV